MCVLVLGMTTNTFSSVPSKASHVYEISQGSIAIPPVNGTAELSIGGSFNSFSEGSCSLFNKVLSVSESFRNIKSSVVNSLGPIINNLKGNIVGMGMYKIQQMNPGLYDLVQNTNYDFTENFNLKVANCQQKMRSLQEGGGLYENIVQVSDTHGYIDMLKEDAERHGKVDLVAKTNELEKKRGEWGIPWIHPGEKNSGGYKSSQSPIKLTSDVIIAGINVMLDSGRVLDDTSGFNQNDKKSGLARYWQSPQQAAKWGTYVLGETQVSTKKNEKARQSTAGYGLSSILYNCPNLNENGDTCIKNVREWLWKLVNNEAEATEEDLIKLSPENFIITADVITTIQNLPIEDRMVAVSSLSEKIATQNVINEALMLRRVIAAGLRVQEVQNIREIRQSILRTQQNLDYEIKSLVFEHDARTKMISYTVKEILNIRQELNAKSSSSMEEKTPLIKDGAIYKNKEETK